MKKITVGIKAFIRLAELERPLKTLEGRGFAEVIVAHDSHIKDVIWDDFF